MPNEHQVELFWWRMELDVSYGLGDDLDLELDVPFDVKDVEARYELPDGTEFDNPQGDIHHRDERLEGIADLKLLLNWRPGSILLENDRLHVGVGVSLPTGRIERNPWVRGDLGIKHQHIQFGTGTVDPVVRLDYSTLPDPVGFLASASLHAPLYENRHDYQGPTTLDVSIGPRLKITEWLVAGASYVASYQTRAYWDHVPDRNSGYFLQGVSFTAPVRLSKHVVLVPTALRTFSIDTRGSSDTFEMDWLLGIGLSVSIGSPSKNEAE